MYAIRSYYAIQDQDLLEHIAIAEDANHGIEIDTRGVFMYGIAGFSGKEQFIGIQIGMRNNFV